MQLHDAVNDVLLKEILENVKLFEGSHLFGPGSLPEYDPEDVGRHIKYLYEKGCIDAIHSNGEDYLNNYLARNITLNGLSLLKKL